MSPPITPVIEPGIVVDGAVQQLTAEILGLQQQLADLGSALTDAKLKAAATQTVIDDTKARLAAARQRLSAAMEG